MSSHKVRKLLCAGAVALALLLPQVISAQPEFSGLPAPGTPTFDLDIAAFRADPDSVYVEIYYRISNPRLSYIRRTTQPGDNTSQQLAADSAYGRDTLLREYYVAAYEMTAILAGDRDPQAATVSRRENYALHTYEETRSPSGYLVNVLTLKILPNDYELSVTLNDRVSGNSYTVKRDLELRQFRESNWLLGGPEFIDPTATPPDGSPFEKGGVGVVPNVKRAYAGTDDRLAMYVEVDRGRAPDATQLVIEVYQRRGRSEFLDTISLEDRPGIVPVIYRHRLPGLTTGEARLRMHVLNAEDRRLGEELETYFWIDWTISSLIREDWEEAVEMLVHIAGGDDTKKLKEATEEDRARLFDEFWESRDPSPDTPENEWKQEYYRRIRFANLRFTNAFQRGWRTDFGTVYVRYGEPDEIERYPFERGQKPFQLWYYYGQNRRFLFVDTRGNGDYELQYPYDGYVR